MACRVAFAAVQRLTRREAIALPARIGSLAKSDVFVNSQ